MEDPAERRDQDGASLRRANLLKATFPDETTSIILLFSLGSWNLSQIPGGGAVAALRRENRRRQEVSNVPSVAPTPC